MTDEELKAWDDDDIDICDELHVHFGKWGRWDWCDIANEARRVYNVMFSDDMEDGSPIDGVITAAVAHADHMAYEAMAAALGVSATDLRCTVALWSEHQDDLPPPVSADRLMQMVAETHDEFAKFEQEHALHKS